MRSREHRALHQKFQSLAISLWHNAPQTCRRCTDQGGSACFLSTIFRDKREDCCHLPTLALPKNRPDLVEDAGGGGFWICEAVGARDWRMEYVRCMVG